MKRVIPSRGARGNPLVDWSRQVKAVQSNVRDIKAMPFHPAKSRHRGKEMVSSNQEPPQGDSLTQSPACGGSHIVRNDKA